MKKIFLLLVALTVSTVIWAEGSVITYTATESLEDFNWLNAVGMNPAANSYDENTKTGVVTFSSDVTSIKDYAFYRCFSLTSITIPASVTAIGIGAFMYCSALTSINLPEGVTSIGEYVFYGCSSMASITLPEGVTSIGDYAFGECASLTSIILPSSLTSISYNAFERCFSLTSIILPSSLEKISDNAFFECSSLTYVICEATTPPTLGYVVFDGCSALTSIFVNTEAVETYKYRWSNYAGKIVGTDSFIDTYKAVAIPEIEAAMNGVDNLTDENKALIDGYKKTINAATDIETINTAKKNALAIISLQKAKNDAISEIEAAMPIVDNLTDEDKAAIDGYKSTINAATDVATVNTAKKNALAIISLQKAKNDAISEIEAAMPIVDNLTDEDKAAIAGYKNTIDAATDVATVNTAKKNALAIISLRPTKNTAIAAIETAMKGVENLTDEDKALIDGYKNTINAATDVATVNTAKDNALAVINTWAFTTWGGKKYVLIPVETGYALNGDEIELIDKDSYQSDCSYSVNRGFTYNRDFSNVQNVWQCWYVPFDVSVDALNKDGIDVAEIAGILLNDVGSTVVAFKEMNSGTVKANTPYVVRLREGISSTSVELELSSGTKMMASEENGFTVQSAYTNFTFTGNYTKKHIDNCYTLNTAGKFLKMGSSVELSPMRFGLTITPRTDGPYYDGGGNDAKEFIDMMVLGDNETTEINDINRNASTDNIMYDLMGRRVTNIQSGQIYIMNGKKFRAR